MTAVPEETTRRLAARLEIPARIAAILWDMDGVLLDTLTLDYRLVAEGLREVAPGAPPIPQPVIRDNFALDPVLFWRELLAYAGVTVDDAAFQGIVERYDAGRHAAAPPVHPGVVEILEAAREAGLRLAVVSNNPEADVAAILRNTGLLDRFDLVIGNDRPGLRKKPAPDCYVEAARQLGLTAAACAVIEDSLVGAQAGRDAGCFVVGVGTGSADADLLQHSGLVDACYPSFANPA